MADPQFLVLSVPDGLKLGGNVRLVAVAAGEDKAAAKLEELDAQTMGRVAVVEVKQMFERRQAIENVPVDAKVIEG